MQFVAVQEVTITRQSKIKGSNRIVYNYDLDGVPFGQVWTYKTIGEVHKWHVAKANGEYIGATDNYKAADVLIRGEM